MITIFYLRTTKIWLLKTIYAKNSCTPLAITRIARISMTSPRPFLAGIINNPDFVLKETLAIIFIKLTIKIRMNRNRVLQFVKNSETTDFVRMVRTVRINIVKLFAEIIKTVFALKARNVNFIIKKLFRVGIIFQGSVRVVLIAILVTRKCCLSSIINI